VITFRDYFTFDPIKKKLIPLHIKVFKIRIAVILYYLVVGLWPCMEKSSLKRIINLFISIKTKIMDFFETVYLLAPKELKMWSYHHNEILLIINGNHNISEHRAEIFSGTSFKTETHSVYIIVHNTLCYVYIYIGFSLIPVSFIYFLAGRFWKLIHQRDFPFGGLHNGWRSLSYCRPLLIYYSTANPRSIYYAL